MNSKLVIFTLILLIILTLFMGIAYRVEKKRRINTEFGVLSHNKTEEEVIIKNIIQNNYLWKLDNLLLMNKEQEIFPMIDLLGNDKIIFFFRETSCESCIQDIINQITSNNKNILTNIILLVDYKNARSFLQEANEIPSGLSMYLIYQGKVHPKQDNVPMFFFIGSSLNLGYNYFYPNKNLLQYTKLYLEENIASINQK